jgi:hypothetical protein
VDGQSIARQRLSKHIITHATIEVRVSIAHCWATSSAIMISLWSVPWLLLCNDSANTFQQQRGSFLCSRWTPIYIKRPTPPLTKGRNNEEKNAKFLTLNRSMAMGPSGARCQEWPCRLTASSKLLLLLQSQFETSSQQFLASSRWEVNAVTVLVQWWVNNSRGRSTQTRQWIGTRSIEKIKESAYEELMQHWVSKFTTH